MHLNYHFLRYLAPALSDAFSGAEITASFSQSKDELIIETERAGELRFIRVHLLPPQVYLSFPTQYARARRNTIDLFEELIGDVIHTCTVFSFERALRFDLASGKILVLKLHGNRSNVLLYRGDSTAPALLFRNEIKEDKTLDWRSLERPIDLTWERFESLTGNAAQFLPTLGAIPRNWLKERNYPESDLKTKWALMQEILDLLDTPLFSLVEKEGEVTLSLLPEPNPISTHSDPITAVNELFYKALVIGTFEKEKNQLLKGYTDQLKKTESYLKKSSEKLEELKNTPPPSQLADVIMANLHQFTEGVQQVELENFYTGSMVKVSLKPNQKPQDLAESLYRKSKNRQLELDQLEKTIQAKRVLETELKEKLQALGEVRDFRGLKNFQKTHKEDIRDKKDAESLPFKVFEYEGFTIWVGKSAKDNDEMLRGFARKEDIWMHARQAAGSHVIIRMRGMTVVPQRVLERAAQLAAFYSKLKSDTLAPVMYTEAKYVRKVKGSAPGSVMVDREKVILVSPIGPDQETAAKK
ncbi:NFACT RNA binding domain-containing protein [Algoriphagus aquatilis]|uniref:NFACT RNA binding domain-containing protein n=1 Tax=Algoriphagus aquatilis TaxID=490186 RepID=A0ABW0BS29_9BACT